MSRNQNINSKWVQNHQSGQVGNYQSHHSEPQNVINANKTKKQFRTHSLSANKFHNSNDFQWNLNKDEIMPPLQQPFQPRPLRFFSGNEYNNTSNNSVGNCFEDNHSDRGNNNCFNSPNNSPWNIQNQQNPNANRSFQTPHQRPIVPVKPDMSFKNNRRKQPEFSSNNLNLRLNQPQENLKIQHALSSNYQNSSKNIPKPSGSFDHVQNFEPGNINPCINLMPNISQRNFQPTLSLNLAPINNNDIRLATPPNAPQAFHLTNSPSSNFTMQNSIVPNFPHKPSPNLLQPQKSNFEMNLSQSIPLGNFKCSPSKNQIPQTGLQMNAPPPQRPTQNSSNFAPPLQENVFRPNSVNCQQQVHANFQVRTQHYTPIFSPMLNSSKSSFPQVITPLPSPSFPLQPFDHPPMDMANSKLYGVTNYKDQMKLTISDWLKKRSGNMKNESPQYLKIFEYKRLMGKYIDVLNKLRSCADLLAQNMNTDDESWKKILDQRSIYKEHMNGLKQKLFDAGQLNFIKSRIAMRKKKRDRIKRRKQRKSQEYLSTVQKRLKMHEKIDEENHQKQLKILSQKMVENLKNEAGESLVEVKRKQSETDEKIKIYKYLKELRDLRKETSIYQGILATESENITFEKNIDAVLNILNQQKKTYEGEEKALRVLREEEAVVFNNLQKEKQKRKKQSRRQDFYMFDPLIPFRLYWLQAEESIPALVNIRGLWDMYLSTNHNSSSIPGGFVQAGEPSSAGWRKYLVKQKQNK